jgi:kynurenine--oxoglutarate transaminase/cysteine-S-conjugate beta-lyase/glutamine--phenylpyruvate transaminase
MTMIKILFSYFTESKCDLSAEQDQHLDYKFAYWFAKTWKVLGIPPSAFYSDPHKSECAHLIRFCFYKKEETLEKADKLLTKFATANKIVRAMPK